MIRRLRRIEWAWSVAALVSVPGCGPVHEGTTRDPGAAASASPASSSDASASTALEPPSDLEKHGLPLTIVVPACAKAVSPAVKVTGNLADVMLLCEASDQVAESGTQVFGIQLGPAKGKIGKAEIAADAAFVRFTKTTPELLEYETKVFGELRRDFMVRETRGGVEYACYPLAGTANPKLLAAEREACLSMRAK